MENELVYEEYFTQIEEDFIEKSFDSLAGRNYWKQVLKSYRYQEETDELFQINHVQFLLLSGPYGSGKTSLVMSMLKELLQHGYEAFEIDLGRIPSEKMTDFFEKFMGESIGGKPCVLFWDNVECIESSEIFYNLEEYEFPLLIIGIAEKLEHIDSSVRKQFDIYQIELPDEEDREAFFSQHMNHLASNYLPDDMKKLVEKTKGYNYEELKSVAKQLALQLKYKVMCKEITIEEAGGFLDSIVVEQVLNKIQEKEMDKDSAVVDNQELLQILSQQMMQMQLTISQSGSMENEIQNRSADNQSSKDDFPNKLDDWLQDMDNFSRSVKND